MMTVSRAWDMPQDSRSRRSGDYDIDPDFPPPSLKPPQTASEKRKKTRKWSIGGLFRRKKKVSDTDSSSPLDDEEDKKGFLERRRAARKKRNRGSKDVTDAFEHVIMKPRTVESSASPEFSERLGRSQDSLPRRQETRGSSVSLDGVRRVRHVKARVEARRPKGESSSDEESSRASSASQRKNEDSGSLSRRSRAARTERYKKRLSRDDESLRDFQVSRISRSDERLTKKKEPNNRWTAKVVYYESSDYDTKYTAITKSATPSPIQSPKARPKNPVHYTASAPPGSTYVTYPPREGVAGSHQELRSQYYPLGAHRSSQRFAEVAPPRLPKASSEMISRTAPSSVPQQHAGWAKDPLNRKSASYDCNVNSLHYVNNQISHPHPSDDNVLVVQFPISRPVQKDKKVVSRLSTTPTLQYCKQINPPPPPPRDPHRRVVNGHHQESSPRPMSYAFEDRNQHNTYTGYPEFGSSVSAFHRVPQMTQIDFQPASIINKQHRSSSDHQIPSRINAVKSSPPTARRPASVQQETVPKSHPLNSESFASSPPSDLLQTAVPHHYQYYTDQHPRSRKPIHIACPNQNTPSDPYLSDSQVVVKPPVQQMSRPRPAGVQNASDFWKQKDQENVKKIHLSEGSPKLIHRHLLGVNPTNERSRSNSPRTESHLVSSKLKLPPLIMPARNAESSGSVSSQSSPRDIPSPRTPVSRKPGHNEIGIPVFDGSDLISPTRREYRPLSMLEEKQEMSELEVSPIMEKLNNPPTPPTRKDSKVNAVTNFEHFDIFDDENNVTDGRGSSNLEEALNELEAIYKSLRLGEEGYLEKMAKEQALYENNRLDPSNWNAWVQSRGFESDSSFNYSRSSLESVDSIDSPIKRPLRRPGVPDRVADDMAFRRFNKKDRPPPLEQEVISQAGSFLLVSPTLSPPPFIEPPPLPPVKNEPDITLDDVVYRNFKHVNNNLKILDPQPPFGIPLGPIAPAANSDYLHATPTETYRPTFKPRRTPDVVSDDLAFRNLRKDNNKEPHFSVEDTTFIDSPTLKKKRAVRSLSANLLSIIQKESLAMNNNNRLLYNNNNNLSGELEKSLSFTDITDAINGTVPISQFVEHVHLVDASAKRIPSGEESDATTPRASRHFYTETSSPSIATSTETLVGSKSSLLSQDPKIQKLSRTSSPRLSLTPERRQTTDSIHLSRASASPVRHVPIKLEPFKTSLTPSTKKSQDLRRSPTPDSHTVTHLIDSKTPPCEQSESDLLAILAREAKEASEQLSKELNELSFEKPVSNENTKHNEAKIEQIKESHQQTPIKQIGKVVPHKAVKLNTFHITEDDKIENKQTTVTNSPGEIEGSTSMTDLLKELTRSLEFDFGLPKDNEDIQEETEHNNATNKLTASESEIALEDSIDTDETQDHMPKEPENIQPIERECDEFFSSLEDNEKDSSPELSLFNSLCEESEPSQIPPTSSPKFPLEIPDDSDAPPSSSEACPLLPREARGCDDCSTMPDEGKACGGTCVSCVGRPVSLEAELLPRT